MSYLHTTKDSPVGHDAVNADPTVKSRHPELTEMADIPLAVTKLSSLAHSLHKAADQLGMRLAPALGNPLPSPGCDATKPSSGSPLSGDLQDIARTLQAALDCLRDLNDRVQL